MNVFTRSLELAERGVRVNAVLPGPFWTPAIATSNAETVARFGSFTMLGRAGQPEDRAGLCVPGGGWQLRHRDTAGGERWL